MADDSLKSWWDARRALLLIHCRCSLPSSTSGSLSVQVLGLVVLAWLLGLHHTHLLSIWRRSLGWIWWRGAPMIRAVHVIVHIRLSMRALCGVLVHLHIGKRRILRRLSLLCRNDLLLRLLTLPAHSLESLLLLNARCWRSARTGLQCHGWYERTGELRLGDERM